MTEVGLTIIGTLPREAYVALNALMKKNSIQNKIFSVRGRKTGYSNRL